MSSLPQFKQDIEQSQVFTPEQKRFILAHLNQLTKDQTEKLKLMLVQEKRGIKMAEEEHRKAQTALFSKYWPKVKHKIEVAHRELRTRSETAERQQNQEEISIIEKMFDQ